MLRLLFHKICAQPPNCLTWGSLGTWIPEFQLVNWQSIFPFPFEVSCKLQQKEDVQQIKSIKGLTMASQHDCHSFIFQPNKIVIRNYKNCYRLIANLMTLSVCLNQTKGITRPQVLMKKAQSLIGNVQSSEKRRETTSKVVLHQRARDVIMFMLFCRTQRRVKGMYSAALRPFWQGDSETTVPTEGRMLRITLMGCVVKKE